MTARTAAASRTLATAPLETSSRSLGERRAHGRAPRWRLPSWLAVLVVYLALSLLTIGRFAVGHPQTVCACVGTEDPALFMWALSWWPHALLHGLNPFVTRYVWSPVGVNTAQATLIPTAALALVPLTALFGPVFSYNLLAIASPVLSALTAYLLCKRLVRHQLAAVIGGYLFGFSSYEFAQLTGHPNLTLTFLIPVMVHVALKRFDNEISPRRYVAVMAILLLLQTGLSTELLAECVGLGAVLLASARLLVPAAQRRQVGGLAAQTVAAGLIALAVGSPFFYYALINGGFPKGIAPYADIYAQDLLNTVFPTAITWVGGHAFLPLSATYVGGGVTGEDGYLGIPLVIGFLAWALGPDRRRTQTRLVLIAATVSFVAALGAHLHIAGEQTVTLPFEWVEHLPIFNDLLPSRIIIFTSLATAVGFAAWLARPSGRWAGRWIVAVIALVMLFPAITAPLYGVKPHNPSFFSTGLFKKYLRPGEVDLILPFGHNDVSTLWQAETHFYFYMPEGYLSQEIPAAFAANPTVISLWLNEVPPVSMLGSFIRQHLVRHVLVDASLAGPWPAVLSQLGLHGSEAGEMLVYTVPAET